MMAKGSDSIISRGLGFQLGGAEYVLPMVPSTAKTAVRFKAIEYHIGFTVIVMATFVNPGKTNVIFGII